MHTYLASIGIIIKSLKYGDGDKIITLFTRDFGKRVFLAKGVRKIKSKKRSSLDLFNVVKFSANESQGLPLLVETETFTSGIKFRNDLKQVSVAFFMVETVDKITAEAEKNEALFDLLYQYLEKLKTTSKTRVLRYQFTIDLLKLLGYLHDIPKKINLDLFLQQITERHLNSIRIGKQLASTVKTWT